jgi:hypothetical protein
VLPTLQNLALCSNTKKGKSDEEETNPKVVIKYLNRRQLYKGQQTKAKSQLFSVQIFNNGLLYILLFYSSMVKEEGARVSLVPGAEGGSGRGSEYHELRLQLVGHELDGDAAVGQRARQVQQVHARLQQGEPSTLPLNLQRLTHFYSVAGRYDNHIYCTRPAR